MKLENIERAREIASEINEHQDSLKVLRECLEKSGDVRIQFSSPFTATRSLVVDGEVRRMLLIYAESEYESKLDALHAELETL